MLKDLDTIVLKTELPGLKLRPGDVGTIVHVHADSTAFEIEFVTLGGQTVDIVTLPREAVRAAMNNEIARVREVAV